MSASVLNTNKILIGSMDRAIKFSRVYGNLCLRELYLLNIVNKLIDEGTLSKTSSQMNQLQSLASDIQAKNDYICNLRDRHITDYHNVIQYNLNLTVNTNTAPTVLDGTVDYDTPTYTFTASDFSNGYSDAEGEPLTNVKITTLPVNGDLSFNGTTVTEVPLQFDISQVSNLTFVRTVALTTEDTFDFQVSDNNINQLFSSMATMTLNINEVINLPPSAIGVNSKTLLHKETHVFTQADFTTDTTPVYLDPDGDIPEFVKITTLPTDGTLKYNNIDVILNQEVPYSEIGNSLFTFVASSTNVDAHDTDFNFSMSDIGSHEFTSGGLFSFSVAAQVNLQATVGDGALVVNEGVLLTFQRADFTANTVPPYFDPEGDLALNLKVTVLPATGLIKLNTIAITANQIISFVDIDAGLLTYTQAVDAGGTMPSFEFEIADAGSGIFSA